MNNNAPRPRLCYLRRWPDFDGFGFNLHAEKNKVGQFIGKVDPDSPAEAAGLLEHDRIVEVNFWPISNDTHKQVVARIKEGVERGNTMNTDEVILLVLDSEAVEYYQRKGIMPKSSDPNVERLEAENRSIPRTPDSPPSYTSTMDKEMPTYAQPTTPIKRGEPIANYKNVTDFTGPEVKKTSERAPSPSSSKQVRQHLNDADDDDDDDDEEEEDGYLQVNPTETNTSARQDKRSIENRPVTGSARNYSPDRNSSKPLGSDSSRNLPPRSSPATKYKVPELDMTAAELMARLKAERVQKKTAQQRNQMSIKDKHALVDKL